MRNDFGISEKSFRLLLETLQKFSDDIEEAVIFGSRALGNYKNGSDIDIALKGKNLNFDKILKISTILNREISSPYKFDVVNYSEIENDDLKNHINKFGKEINFKNKLYG